MLFLHRQSPVLSKSTKSAGSPILGSEEVDSQPMAVFALDETVSCIVVSALLAGWGRGKQRGVEFDVNGAHGMGLVTSEFKSVHSLWHPA